MEVAMCRLHPGNPAETCEVCLAEVSEEELMTTPINIPEPDEDDDGETDF